MEADFESNLMRNERFLDDNARAILRHNHLRRLAVFDRYCRLDLWQFCEKLDDQAREIANLNRYSKKLAILAACLAGLSFWMLGKLLGAITWP